MSKEAIKMAEVFKLPVDDGDWVLDDEFKNRAALMASGFCRTGDPDHYAAHAINTHDALIQERDEWKESSEFNYQQYNDLMTQTVKDSEESERINDALVQHNAELTEALRELLKRVDSDLVTDSECEMTQRAYQQARAALSKEQGQ